MTRQAPERTYVSIALFPLLGKTFIASSAKGVLRIGLAAGSTRTHAALLVEKHPGKVDIVEDGRPNKPVAKEIRQYLEGRRKRFTIRPCLFGTEFQRRVWRAAARIPHGKTVSYSELAARVGAPGAARAVGSALGANPVPIIIPCHRVIRADGTLGGFGAGLRLKKALLDLERNVRIHGEFA